MIYIIFIDIIESMTDYNKKENFNTKEKDINIHANYYAKIRAYSSRCSNNPAWN